VDKNKVDVAQAFLMYMLCCGDVGRVAAGLNLEPEQVREMAESESWNIKLQRISVISKSGKPGDFERAQNRALCFIQAQLLRTQLNRLLVEVTNMTDEELLSRASVRTRDGGQQISAKFFTDMTNAAEACHRMTYMALGDTVTERQEREVGGSGGSSNDLHVAIIAHLSDPAGEPAQAVKLLEAETNAELRRLTPVDVTAEPLVNHPERQSLPVT
jgi:hypothetical protein